MEESYPIIGILVLGAAVLALETVRQLTYKWAVERELKPVRPPRSQPYLEEKFDPERYEIGSWMEPRQMSDQEFMDMAIRELQQDAVDYPVSLKYQASTGPRVLTLYQPVAKER